MTVTQQQRQPIKLTANNLCVYIPSWTRGNNFFYYCHILLQVELRARNCQLERDNETFRVEVESTLEVIEDVVTRNSKKGHEVCSL